MNENAPVNPFETMLKKDPALKLKIGYYISNAIAFCLSGFAAVWICQALMQSVLDKEVWQFGVSVPLAAWLVFSFVKIASGIEDYQVKFKTTIKEIEKMQQELNEMRAKELEKEVAND